MAVLYVTVNNNHIDSGSFSSGGNQAIKRKFSHLVFRISIFFLFDLISQ